MARRRGNRAPYEIMGAVSRGSAAGAPESPMEPIEPEYVPQRRAAAWWEAWRGASVPVILRVPRGFAVLGAAGVVGLIVLAYWVGYSRGVNAAEAALADQQAQLRLDRVPRTGQVVEVRPSRAARADREAGGVAGGGEVAWGDSRGDSAGDPRRIGLNYLILARYPRTEAVRLASFLESSGLEVAVVSSDNENLFHVVGLRGFTTEEYRAGRHEPYMDQMRRLGREWKRLNNGKGSDLSDMWWKLHQ